MEIDKSTWQKVRFGDCVIEKKITVDARSSGLERYIAGEHMASEDLHLRKWGIIGDDYLGPAFHRKFDKGDILYGSRRTYLKKVAIADFNGITANTTFVLTEYTDVVVPGIIPFLMLSEGFTEHSIKNSKGSVNPYINYKDIAKFEFLLPPKEQQAKLSELLCTADDVIEKYKALETVLKKSLIDFVNSRLSYDKDLSKSIITDIGFIPDGWNLMQLKECLVGKPQYGANAPSIVYNSSLPRYIRITDINDDGDLIDEELVSIGSDHFEDYILKPNDFLFARTGNTVGKTFLYKKEHGIAVYAGYLIKVQLNESILLPEFLDIFCRSNKYTSFKRKSVKVGAQPNINAEQYSNMWLPVPTIDVQKRIVESYTAIKEKLRCLQQQTLPGLQKVQKEIVNLIFS